MANCGCLPTRHSKTPLTLLMALRMPEQVKVQVQRSGKMKTWLVPEPKGSIQ